MVDLFSNLALGFGVAFSPINLLMCLIGSLVGTLVGVLPGIGTIATVAMLLPYVRSSSAGALIMLAGIYCGAQYVRPPRSWSISREATSVVWHRRTLAKRAAGQRCVAAIGSFFAGCVATV
jgi:putative tricarboxylic transport membrane protein